MFNKIVFIILLIFLIVYSFYQIEKFDTIYKLNNNFYLSGKPKSEDDVSLKIDHLNVKNLCIFIRDEKNNEIKDMDCINYDEMISSLNLDKNRKNNVCIDGICLDESDLKIMNGKTSFTLKTHSDDDFFSNKCVSKNKEIKLRQCGIDDELVKDLQHVTVNDCNDASQIKFIPTKNEKSRSGTISNYNPYTRREYSSGVRRRLIDKSLFGNKETFTSETKIRVSEDDGLINLDKSKVYIDTEKDNEKIKNIILDRFRFTGNSYNNVNFVNVNGSLIVEDGFNLLMDNNKKIYFDLAFLRYLKKLPIHFENTICLKDNDIDCLKKEHIEIVKGARPFKLKTAPDGAKNRCLGMFSKQYHPKINEGIQDLNTLTDIDCNNGNLNNEFYINREHKHSEFKHYNKELL